MDEELTPEQLSARTGATPAEIESWRALGLLAAGGTYAQEDVERTRLLQFMLRRGTAIDTIAEAERQQPFLAGRLERMFPRGIGRSFTLEEAAAEARLDADIARRFWEIANIADDDTLYEEDVAALRGARRVLESGFPEEGLLEVSRVCADTLSRAADGAQKAFHIHMHEALRAAGMATAELDARHEEVATVTRASLEPTILYFLRKANLRALREDIVLHVAEDAGLLEISDVPGTLWRAVVFVDLSSSTSLADVHGDVVAAELGAAFSRIVRDAARRAHGQVIKQMGDGFMLVFPDAPSAVEAALAIERAVAAQPQFPAIHSGVHWGQMLYREGDYVGAGVNLASRLANEAGPHQTFVTMAVRAAAHGLADVEFVPLGRRALRGVAEEIELFAATSGRDAASAKRRDPVCGMEITDSEVVATLATGGREHAFCSDECLRRFVANPQRYGPGG